MAKRRKRASRDKVRENAAKGSGGGSDWFNVPEDVGRWTPDKAGRYSIDVLPYEVKSKNHPDDVEKDCLWYKFPFAVHHGIGASNQSFVCPQSVGAQCPICDERNRLYKEDSDKNEDIIKDLRPQKFVAYNILDPEDDQKVCLFILSRGKFAVCLEDELKDPDNEEHLAFFDVNEDGRTLRVRFSESTFQGKKYLEATKIDFKQRDEMDEDETLEKTVCLEEALIVPPADKLKSLFFQEDDEDDEDEPEEKPKRTRKPPKEEETEEDEPEEDEPEDEPEDDEDEGANCAACGGTGKSSKGKKCVPCGGTGVQKDDEPENDDDDDEDDEPEPAPKKKTAKKAPAKKTSTKKAPKKEPEDEPEDDDNPTCPVKGGKFGQVDQYDECDDCPHWDECEEASD